MTVIKRGSFNINGSIRKLKRKKSTLPRQVGNVAKLHFLDSFRRMGFTDNSLQRWQKRRARRGSGFEPSNLTKSGRLKRDIRVKAATFARTVIGTSRVVYAAIHNFGLKGLAFGKIPFDMPKRQFIGDSKVMDRKIIKVIDREIRKIF